MYIVAIAAILYFLIGAVVCLLICVNPTNPGLLGALRRAVFVSLPNAFSSTARRVFGARALQPFARVKHYLTETNHPLIQWFYFLIAVGAFAVYAYIGIYKYMPNRYITNYNVFLAYLMAAICYWIYYKACSVSPGRVDKANSAQYVQRYKEYYDGVLYKKDNYCKSCQVLKPARSKHCSICKMCVSKFDHHCVWIRQCVGQKNYKYFISFLFLHSLWSGYLAIIASVSIYQSLDSLKFWETTFKIGNQLVRGDNFLAIQYILVTDTWLFFIICMCAIVSVSLFVFSLYHLSLVWSGQTTNERIKRSGGIAHFRKQLKQIGKYEKNNPELAASFEYQGRTMTRKQFLQHKQDVNRQVGILEKWKNKLGMYGSLKQICLEPES